MLVSSLLVWRTPAAQILQFPGLARYQVLGDRMLGVIAELPSLARFQLADALAFAKEQGIPFEDRYTSEFERPEYVRNDGAPLLPLQVRTLLVMEGFGKGATSKASPTA